MTGPYFFDSCRITLCTKGLVYTAIIRMKMAYIILNKNLNIELRWILNSLGLVINTSTTYGEPIPLVGHLNEYHVDYTLVKLSQNRLG